MCRSWYANDGNGSPIPAVGQGAFPVVLPSGRLVNAYRATQEPEVRVDQEPATPLAAEPSPPRRRSDDGGDGGSGSSSATLAA